MAFCENCGKPVYPLDTVCSNCGTPVVQSAQPAAQPAPVSIRQEEVEPSSNSPYAVLSSWGFVGSILLMALPIAGFIIAIVWASGGTFNLNRRNLARGYLLIIGIMFALYIVLIIGIFTFGISPRLIDSLRF